jgi:hypothetical protein
MKMINVLAACLLLSGCGVVQSPYIPGSEAAAAKDQIMLVRQDPPSLGYHRLLTQSRTYPDIALFMNKRGVPDFLAETGNWERHYFILYYLRDRDAFACRTRSSNKQAVEFAGPYPITDSEYKLLDELRKTAAAKMDAR